MVTREENFSLALFIINATSVGIKYLQPFREPKLSRGVLYDNGNCPTDIQVDMRLYNKLKFSTKDIDRTGYKYSSSHVLLVVWGLVVEGKGDI